MKFIVILLFLKSDSLNTLKFAKSLEKEGDYYRAITEYKRYLYSFNLNREQKDSILLKIADLNLRLKLYKEALAALRRIKDTTTKKFKLIKGFLFLNKKEFEKSRKYLRFSDTLYAYTFLKEKKFKEFEKISGIRLEKINHPNPYLAGFLSTLLPGSGKVYSGRFWDGLFSFIINFASAFTFYHYYSKNPKSVGTYISGGVAFLFYFSNIYGSYVSAIHERKIREAELIFKTELNLGILSRFSKWLY